MKAAFFYDGSLKSWNDDDTLNVIKDATNVVKAGIYYLIDNEAQKIDGSSKWTIDSPAKQACIYGGKLFYYGIDDKLYMCAIKGKSTMLCDNSSDKRKAKLTPGGIVIGFNFYKPDGSFVPGSFWSYDTIIKVEKVGSMWFKYYFNNGIFVEIGSGYYSDFVKLSSLITPEKIIFTRGATLDLATLELKEPVYSAGLGKFIEGNIFQANVQPYSPRTNYYAIGLYDGKGYFFNSRNGHVDIYDIENDTLTTWVNLVPGIESDDITESDLLFKNTAPVIIGDEIVYFNGSSIMRVNIDLGELNEIAEATDFKGWAQ